MRDTLDQLQKQALSEIEAAKDKEALYKVEVAYLGRKGALTDIFKQFATLPVEEKKTMGVLCNEAKNTLMLAVEKKTAELENKDLHARLTSEHLDLTLPGVKRPAGHIHPLSQVQHEVEEIFNQMGFSVMDGPEIESEYYNFEGLNIPEHHPARDMQDTFFIETGVTDKKHGRLVLRTHTSPVQVRTLERFGAPMRAIVPGRTFRNEATDASHEHTFHQVEGLMVDTHISIADLKGVMQTFLSRLFGKDVLVRFRPGYFPFVEPGMELDFSCLLCDGKGCRVCKHTGWMEFMGCGMVHPSVLRAGGVDERKYQGWAFGLGLERLAMMRYDIDDIRLFQGGDLRFLQQF